MDTIYWRLNATQGGANLHPGVNLLPGANLHSGANCAHEHGLRLWLASVAIVYILNAKNLAPPILSTFT